MLRRYPFTDNSVYSKVLYYSELNLVYSFIPKNACTILKLGFGRYGDAWPEGEMPHNKKYDARFLNFNYSVWESSKKLIVLRDPLRRAVSGYLDKIVKFNEPFAIQAVKTATEMHGRSLSGDTCDLTFREFVTYLRSMPNNGLDHHFRPQIDFYVFDDYDYVFSVENITTQHTLDLGYASIPLSVKKHHKIPYGDEIEEGVEYMPAYEIARLNAERGYMPSPQSFLTREVRHALQYRFADDILLYESHFGSLDNS